MSTEMAKQWVIASHLDLENIRYILQVVHLTPVVAFHSQQAIEKVLKAYMEHSEVEIPKTHKLQTLLDRVELVFEVDDNTLQLIDKLYIDSRYPGNMGLLPYGQPTLQDAQIFYETAQYIFDTVCTNINIAITEENC